MSSTTPFRRYMCLDLKRLPEVINTEALSVDRTMFLATHVPMEHLRLEQAASALAHVDEGGLLELLRQSQQQDRHELVVIKGIPGTGKSHLIRWLYERQRDDSSPNDLVLPIERANASLRGTLRQLIKSGVFDDATSSHLLQRLQNAAMSLEGEKLGETLLNNFQIASIEGRLPDGSAPMKILAEYTRYFLLNRIVREQLLAANGPMERIGRYLNAGNQGLPADEFIGFRPDDLKFPPDCRRKLMADPDEDVRELTNGLFDDEILRQRMAAFLNGLMPEAIARTTELSGEDLRTIFLDLRRSLKRRGKGLSLFIEDITSFTGIDRALMDVLVTQHTGEGGRELCRLTSVIGVTDAFWKDSIPDNIKQRVTYVVGLEQGEQGQLATPGEIALFVGRYLNALRVGPEGLDAWVRDRAVPGDLPNGCTDCQFRETCHAAFGATPGPDLEEPGDRIGLYPFNEQSLSTMFRRLDSQRVKQTPRSLLRSVVYYVLESHGAKIATGNFPPPRRQLGDDFASLPQIDGNLLDILEQKGGSRWESLRTMFEVWGDCTIEVRDGESGPTVGSLRRPAFEAFGLPFIDERPGSSGQGVTDSGRTGGTGGATSGATGGTGGATSGANGQQTRRDVPPRALTPLEERRKLIADWRDGDPLLQYGTFARLLANLFLAAVDWDAHGISQTLAGQTLTPGAIFIEGQQGASRRALQLTVQRSREVANVLLGLVNLTANDASVTPDMIGAGATVISGYLHAETPRIVEFVRFGGTAPTPGNRVSITTLAARNAAAIAVLRGGVRPEQTLNSEDLLLAVIEQRAPGRSPTPSRQERDEELENLKTAFGSSWEGVRPEQWSYCNPQLLTEQIRQTFDQSRGDPGDAWSGLSFCDAASLLDELDAFRAEGWAFPSLTGAETPNFEPWLTQHQSSRFFSHHLATGLSAVAAEAELLRQRLETACGSHSGEEITDAIRQVLEVLQKAQRTGSWGNLRSILPNEVEAVRTYLVGIMDNPDLMTGGAALLSSDIDMKSARVVVRQLSGFSEFLSDELAWVEQTIDGLGLTSDIEGDRANVDGMFDGLISLTTGRGGQR